MKLFLKTFGWVLLIVVGVLLGRLTTLQKPVRIPAPPPTRSDEEINLALKEAEKAQADTVGKLWDFIKGIKRVRPTGFYGTPDKDPFPPRIITETRIDTLTNEKLVEHYLVSPIDVPISVKATDDEIVAVTRNSWLAFYKKDYAKKYIWPRLRKDFVMSMYESTSPDKLDGLQINFITRKFEWNGIWVSAGIEFPTGGFLGLETSWTFYEQFGLRMGVTTFADLSTRGAAGIRWKL